MRNPWTLRPLAGHRVDARLYHPRAEDLTVDRALRQGLNLVLEGESGSGKTTTLNLAGLRVNDQMDLQVIDAADVEDGPALGLRVAETLFDDGRPMAAGTPLRRQLQVLLTQFEHAGEDGELPEKQQVFVIDGAPPAAIWDLFGVHRDQMWALGGQWVVTGQQGSRAELLRPPADSFFNMVVTLSPLPDAASRELVEQRIHASEGRVNIDPDQLDLAISGAGGNPRRLLQLVTLVMAGGARPEDLLEAEAVRNDRVYRMGRAPSMLFTELVNLGQASASDETLLARMGWTRPRAAKIFKELEDAGLVTGEQRRSTGGRPRRVFRPVTAEEFRDKMITERVAR